MILAAQTFATNADLMRACLELGYLDPTTPILDPTYGRGTWWKGLDVVVHAHDLNDDHVDFRNLPHPKGSFTQAVFDPPYVAVGGRKTSTVDDFNNAYGLVTVPKTPAELHDLMVEGLAELHRVVTDRGVVLFKAMNYVTSGRYHPQAYDVLFDVTSEGLYRLKDEFIFLRPPGPQPPRASQLHARRNYSHLFVLEVRK